MTTAHITQEIRDAAAFMRRHHHDLPLDHPAVEMAAHTLRSAGVWAVGEVDVPDTTTPVEVTMQLQGTFCSGDRNRVIYRLLADGIEIGTAIHWTSKTAWPWGLNLPAGCVVNFGFRNKGDLLRAVERFVKTGEIV